MDREFVIMFTLVDENQSWYLDENIRHFCTDPDSVDKHDAVFQRSNKMHGECLPCQEHTACLLCFSTSKDITHTEIPNLVLQDL